MSTAKNNTVLCMLLLFYKLLMSKWSAMLTVVYTLLGDKTST